MNMLTSFFVILFILIGAAVIYIVFGWSVGVYLARKFAFPDAHSLEKTYADSLESGDFTEEEFRNYQFQPFSIESSFGFRLYPERSVCSRQRPVKNGSFRTWPHLDLAWNDQVFSAVC